MNVLCSKRDGMTPVHLAKSYCLPLLLHSCEICGALHFKTSCVSCVCDWLRDATGLDFGDPSWICNAALVDPI